MTAHKRVAIWKINLLARFRDDRSCFSSLSTLQSSLFFCSSGYFIITSIYKGTSDGGQSSLSNRPTSARTRFHIVYLFKRPLLHLPPSWPTPLVNDRSHWQLIRFDLLLWLLLKQFELELKLESGWDSESAAVWVLIAPMTVHKYDTKIVHNFLIELVTEKEREGERGRARSAEIEREMFVIVCLVFDLISGMFGSCCD